MSLPKVATSRLLGYTTWSVLRVSRISVLQANQHVWQFKRPCTTFNDFKSEMDKARQTPPQIVPKMTPTQIMDLEKLQTLITHRLPDYKLNKRQCMTYEQLLNRDPTNLNRWLKLCVGRPTILSINYEHLLSTCHMLMVDMGFSKADTFKLFTILPEVLLAPKNFHILQNAMDAWLGFCQVRSLEPVNILKDIPNIVMYEPTLWNERFSSLSEYFATKSQISTLITNVPSVLLEGWPPLKKKLDLLIKEMQVHPISIAKSYVMSYNTLHIRVRYEFLLRAGLYKHPSTKALGAESKAYPLIDVIVESDFDTFMNDVVGHDITKEEFDLFTQLLQEEHDTLEERQWYGECGYEDPEFREDLAQDELDQSGFRGSKKSHKMTSDTK